ncbi:MAG: hypothetical protein F6J90_25275 [Moorea sp. SIOASIH]|nr:hypothetical protein [Moorena sp. SIOASIH]
MAKVLSSNRQHRLTFNRLTFNRLTFNRLTFNRLTFNLQPQSTNTFDCYLVS